MQFYTINDMCVCVCVGRFNKNPYRASGFGKLLQKIGFTKLTAKCGDIWL